MRDQPPAQPEGPPSAEAAAGTGLSAGVERQILDSLLEGCMVIGFDWTYLYVNEAAARHGQARREGLLGRTMPQAYPGVERTATFARFRRCMEERVRLAFESDFTFPDGSTRWFDVSVSPVPEGIFVLTVDITDRKRAEEALRAGEEHFRLAFENANIGMCLVDLQGRLFRVNRRMSEIFGYSRAELEGMTVNDIAHPDFRDVSPRFIHQATEGEADRTEFEKEYIHKDGRLVRGRVASSLVRDARGEPLCFISHVVDISEKREAEDALRKSEERLRLAVRAANIGIFSLDIATDRFTVDDQARRIFALGEERDLRWRDTRLRVHPDDLERHAQAVRGLVDPAHRGRVEALEYRLVLPGGETRWVSVAAMACFPESAGPVRRAETIVGAAMDITGRKESEERVLGLNRELEDRVAARTAELAAAARELEIFSYSVSHDLRAPLRAIEGFAGMIVKDGSRPLASEDLRRLDVVRTNARRMAVLIEDLLAFTRSGRQEVRSRRLLMKFLARSAFEEVVPDAEERARIDFRLEALPDAFGDAALVRQVWLNLISNAVKYSSRRERPEIEVGGSVEGAFSVYTVRDNGVGFDMARSGGLFGVFRRLHSVAEFEGTGVGLALVKRIVERHGGRTWAEGQVGAGATFSFSLPVDVSTAKADR